MTKAEKINWLEKKYQVNISECIDKLVPSKDKEVPDTDYNCDVVAYGGVNSGVGIVTFRDTGEEHEEGLQLFNVVDIHTWEEHTIPECYLKKIGVVPATVARHLEVLSMAKKAWGREFYRESTCKGFINLDMNDISNYPSTLLTLVGKKVSDKSGLGFKPYVVKE